MCSSSVLLAGSIFKSHDHNSPPPPALSFDVELYTSDALSRIGPGGAFVSMSECSLVEFDADDDGDSSCFTGTGADIGVAVVAALLIIDILYPGSTGIVRNVGELSKQIPASSQASLVGLLLFLLLYQRRT